MTNKNSWLFLYNYNDENWSLPKGFSETLRNLGLNIIDLTFKNDKEIKLPDKKFIDKNYIEVLLVFYAGYSEKLNSELIEFKSKFPKVIIIAKFKYDSYK